MEDDREVPGETLPERMGVKFIVTHMVAGDAIYVLLWSYAVNHRGREVG